MKFMASYFALFWSFPLFSSSEIALKANSSESQWKLLTWYTMEHSKEQLHLYQTLIFRKLSFFFFNLSSNIQEISISKDFIYLTWLRDHLVWTAFSPRGICWKQSVVII